ncbi:undecaprenyldiphospho-muramoylpentapeptide beta-N-acetylglucosaminyltransferase [uncultured Ruminococcus sp.]|uniref:undecaprenyldiphospho-muramoylpentapeptide beta-N-acetylglucosaminyltransferase n=1 Tax=uncultured Ruminococcus sp. TaxID=165186 RepID=UPI00292E4829|nr:undecaprenyldiphospho-muramoylpentapeptide beta-N-acetylglucosaminyltransferase [uncultured Ruminococcus sp.]
MKVLLAGGGTAGHINPALAIAGYIKEQEPDAEFLFIGNRDGMEQRLVKQAGFPIESVVISGFHRSFAPKEIIHNIKTVHYSFSSRRTAKKIIREFDPDICIGTGGYVSGPVILAACNLGYPAVIHEQNAYPGVTNKMLAGNVSRVMLANDDARPRFTDKARFVLTGNPIRPSILATKHDEAKKRLGLDDSKPIILSFGGSLGAKCINEAMAELIARSAKDKKYYHIHAYGQQGTWMPDLLKEKGVDIEKCDNLDIRQYIDNMNDCLAACDLVVSRAGAITLSEIQAKGRPAVLIPSPYVTENHQYHNAMSMVRKKAAKLIEEKDLDGKTLIETVDSILTDLSTLGEYRKNAQSLAITDANERIYKTIKEVLAEKSRSEK